MGIIHEHKGNILIDTALEKLVFYLFNVNIFNALKKEIEISKGIVTRSFKTKALTKFENNFHELSLIL